MGKRDYRWKEPKKPKKDAKRPAKTNILPTPINVEVVRKGKKAKEEE